jgi:dTDP-4-amino-4,6-dideoxygalactose transaminase
VDRLLAAGGGLSGYRSNPSQPVGPREGTWAWKLERLAREEFNVRHAIAVNSGTMALMAALKGLDLPDAGRGGEIITTPYTFSATAAAIQFMGYRPVFADVSPLTYTLDPDSVRRVASRATVGIMPVDLFGGLADYGDLKRLGYPIIQDACQAVGATRDWLHGRVAAWSFNGAKNVPAGEAGMVLTDDHHIAMRARLFISHGENWGKWEDGASIGINGRLNEITACVAYYGMKEVKANNARRRVLAGVLWERLLNRSELLLPGPDAIDHHAFYVYPFRLVDRTRVSRAMLIKRLKALGVEVGAGYITPPLHQYEALPKATVKLPVVEELSEQSLCLLSQVRPPATKDDMHYIATCIEAALDGVIPAKLRKMGFISDSVF